MFIYNINPAGITRGLCRLCLSNKKNDWEFDSAGNRHHKSTLDRRYRTFMHRLPQLIARRLRIVYKMDPEKFFDAVTAAGYYDEYDRDVIELAEWYTREFDALMDQVYTMIDRLLDPYVYLVNSMR